MSIRTRADEHLDAADEQLGAAKDALMAVTENLASALDKDVWGGGEYKQEYLDTIISVHDEAHVLFCKVLSLKRQLDR